MYVSFCTHALCVAGRGTTGTHSLHEACCELSLPSVHYFLSCHVEATDTRERGAEEAEHDGLVAHRRLVRLSGEAAKVCMSDKALRWTERCAAAQWSRQVVDTPMLLPPEVDMPSLMPSLIAYVIPCKCC